MIIVVMMFGHCDGGSCCHQHDDDDSDDALDYAMPTFTSNSSLVEWKMGPPETVNMHSDSDIEVSAGAFVAYKV